MPRYFIEYMTVNPNTGEYERIELNNLNPLEAIEKYNALVIDSKKTGSAVLSPALYKVSTECICRFGLYEPVLFDSGIHDGEGF